MVYPVPINAAPMCVLSGRISSDQSGSLIQQPLEVFNRRSHVSAKPLGTISKAARGEADRVPPQHLSRQEIPNSKVRAVVAGSTLQEKVNQVHATIDELIFKTIPVLSQVRNPAGAFNLDDDVTGRGRHTQVPELEVQVAMNNYTVSGRLSAMGG